MIRLVIADDEALVRERIRSLLAPHADIDIVAECSDGAAAVAAIETHRPDLALLDIRMPELDGFEVLDALPADARPAVVFVTAYDQHAVRGFDANAVDYILKPIDPARFDAALTRVRTRLGEPAGARDARLDAVLAELRRAREVARRIVVRNGSAVEFVAVPDIDWIDADGNYARLHVGPKAHLLREPLRSLEQRLDPEQFVRIHRSVIVNLERIARLEPWFHGEYVVTLRDGTKLTSSRTRSAALRERLK